MSSPTGLIVPSELDTWMIATSRVRASSSASNASSRARRASVDRHDAQRRAGLLAQQLPRHDVRVVLHLRDEDLVAGLQIRAAAALRDEVDALGGAAREDDLAAIARR